jgi:two-component system response regulator RegX3
VCTRAQLLAHVWATGGGASVWDARTADVPVRRLRAKLEADPGVPALLETVWGVGYRTRRQRDRAGRAT